MIACVFIPEFAIAAHRHDTDATEPLLLVRSGKQRRIILDASSAAKACGVEVGYSLSRARALCPAAQIVTADPDRIRRAQDRLLDVLWEFTNRVEVDEAFSPQTAVCYLDLGSLNAEALAYLGEQLIRTLREKLQLAASIGLATRKFAAYVAAASTATGTAMTVVRGEERAFVGTKSLGLLAMPREMKRRLDLYRIRTFGQFAALPRPAILSQFGKPGRLLYDLANGMDSRPVIPRRLPKTERLRYAFDDAPANRTHIDTAIREMAGILAQRLDERVSALHEMTLTLDLEGGSNRTEQLHLLQPVASAKAIAQTIGQLIDRAPLDQPIAAMEVCLTHLVPNVPRQMELFTQKPARQQLLDLTRVLVERYGSDVFYEAQFGDRASLLPERRFTLLHLEVS